MDDADVEARIVPIRGGTDGAKFHIWEYQLQTYLQEGIISTDIMVCSS